MVNKYQSPLLKALKFISCNGAKTCQFHNGIIYSEKNGIVLSYAIDEFIDGTFYIEDLKKTLDNLGPNIAFTQLDKFLQANNDELKITLNNINIYDILVNDFFTENSLDGSDFVQDLLILQPIPCNKGNNILTSVNFNNSLISTTNKKIILQVLTDFNFGEDINFNINKEVLNTLKRIKPKQTFVKTSNTKLQFIFDEKSKMCFEILQPEDFDYNSFFEIESLFENNLEFNSAISQLSPFLKEKLILENNEIYCEMAKYTCSNFNVDSIYKFYAEEMKQILICDDFEFAFDNTKFIFRNEKIRGVVSCYFEENEND